MIAVLQAERWMYDHADLYMQPTSLGQWKGEFFQTYNILTGENKRPTSCGRCLSGMRLRLQNIKKILDQMKTYKVYRTEKGNLSFKVQPELAYTIRAKSDAASKAALVQLKKDDKQFYGK